MTLNGGKWGGGGFMAFTQFLQGCQEILQQVLVLDDSLFNWSCRGRWINIQSKNISTIFIKKGWLEI